MERNLLSEKEKVDLDKQIDALQDKVFKMKHEYDSLTDQLSELLMQRYPDRQTEYIKDVLYDAYSRSHKSLELIVILYLMIIWMRANMTNSVVACRMRAGHFQNVNNLG